MSEYHHAVLITDGEAPKAPDTIHVYDFNKKDFIKVENKDSNEEPYISLKRRINVKSADIIKINNLSLHKMHLTNHTGKLKDVNTIIKMVKNGELDFVIEESGEAVMYVYKIKKTYPYNTYNTFINMNGVLVNLIDLKTLIGAKFTERFAEFISKELSGTLELEYEKTYLTMILFTKKRYYTLKHDGKIDVKGLEIVRRDWSEATKEMVRRALNYLLTYNEGIAMKKILELFDSEVERFMNYDFSVDEVTKVQKLSASYKSKNLPQVTASEILRRMGYFVQPGMEVSYIILKQDRYVRDLFNKNVVPFPHRPDNQKFTRVLPVDIIDTREELSWNVLKKHVDIEDVIETNIIKPLSRILELFGYNTSDLWKSVRSMNNHSLMSFIQKSDSVNPLARPQKVKKDNKSLNHK